MSTTRYVCLRLGRRGCERTPVKLYTVTISRSHLDALSEDEQALFVQLGTLHNELNISLKFMLMADSAAHQSHGPDNTGYVTQSWFFMTLLALKLYEGRRTLLEQSYHGTKLSERYRDKLSPKGQHGLKQINKYFDRPDNLISKIRNEIAAHYLHDAVKAQIRNLPSDHESECILCEDIRGNCLFALSRDIMIRQGLGFVGPLRGQEKEFLEKLNKLFREISDVTGWFLDFIHDCLCVIVEQMDLDQPEVVEIDDPAPLDESVLPFFWPQKDRI